MCILAQYTETSFKPRIQHSSLSTHTALNAPSSHYSTFQQINQEESYIDMSFTKKFIIANIVKQILIFIMHAIHSL